MSRVLVTFSVAVRPIPRPALVASPNGNVHYLNSPEYRKYKATLRDACEEALPGFWSPYDKPTEIRIVCQYARLKSRPKAEWKDTAPDHENLLKPIQDAMTGLVYTDDKTVVVGKIAKVFGDEDRVTVQVLTTNTRDEVLCDWFAEEG